MFIYSVYDSAAAVYMRPFFEMTDSSAMRMFGDISVDVEHPIGKHPEHYSLYRIGIWDDANARIEPEEGVCIARAHELVAHRQAIQGNSGGSD